MMTRLRSHPLLAFRSIIASAIALAAVYFVAIGSFLVGRPDRDIQGKTNGLALQLPDVSRSAPDRPSPLRSPHRSLLGGDNLPCTIDKLDLTATKASGTRISLEDRSAPSLLSGWSPPSTPHPWSRDHFLSDFGTIAQYVKNEAVQPYRDAKGTPCVAPTSEVAQLLSEPHNAGRMLFFTNDKENRIFFRAMEPHYLIPAPLRHVDGFKVFSAMERGGSHPFHKHGEAWLGQTSGARAWWFLPPAHERPSKVNGCDYLANNKPGINPPEGAFTCVQEAGDVVHVPAEWWHATCALESWSAGIGAQKGNPAVYDQDFGSLDLFHENPPAWFGDAKVLSEKMKECGVAAGHKMRTAAALDIEFKASGV